MNCDFNIRTGWKDMCLRVCVGFVVAMFFCVLVSGCREQSPTHAHATAAEVTRRPPTPATVAVRARAEHNESAQELYLWQELWTGGKWVKHGLFQIYSSEGRLVGISQYGGGYLHGVVTEWYESGQIKQVLHWESGVLAGEYKQWFENGRIAESGHYQSGRLHGEWQWWWASGITQIMGAYDQNVMIGDWKFYNEAGEVLISSSGRDLLEFWESVDQLGGSGGPPSNR